MSKFLQIAELAFRLTSGVILLSYIANSLELKDYELLVYVVFLLGAGQLLVRFGLDSLGPVGILTEDKIDYKFLRSVLLSRILAFALLLCTFPLIFFVGLFKGDTIDAFIVFLGVFIVIFDVFKYAIERHSRSDLIVIARFSSFAPSLLIRLFGAYLGNYKVILFGVVLELFVFVFVTRKISPKSISLQKAFPNIIDFDFKTAFANIPFLLIGIYVYFYVRYPIWAEWSLYTENDKANFIFAYKLIEPFFALSGIYLFILSSSIMKVSSIAARDELLILALGFFIGLCISVLIFSISDIIIFNFFRAELHESVEYLKVLCFTLPFNFLGSLWQRFCLARSDFNAVYFRNISSCFVFVVLLLLPKQDVWSALFSYLLFIIIHDGVLPAIIYLQRRSN